jgi:hypothetical protein
MFLLYLIGFAVPRQLRIRYVSVNLEVHLLHIEISRRVFFFWLSARKQNFCQGIESNTRNAWHTDLSSSHHYGILCPFDKINVFLWEITFSNNPGHVASSGAQLLLVSYQYKNPCDSKFVFLIRGWCCATFSSSLNKSSSQTYLYFFGKWFLLTRYSRRIIYPFPLTILQQ